MSPFSDYRFCDARSELLVCETKCNEHVLSGRTAIRQPPHSESQQFSVSSHETLSEQRADLAADEFNEAFHIDIDRRL